MNMIITGVIEDQEALAELQAQLYAEGYREHHTSFKRGYVSRKLAGIVSEYTGHFGTGYTIEEPFYGSTNYHHITYWVKEA